MDAGCDINPEADPESLKSVALGATGPPEMIGSQI